MAQFGVVSFVPLSGPCSTNTLGFDTTNNVVYSCGSPPNNYWKVVTFETVSQGPLSGTCNPNSLGFDTTNNVVYSCGTAPNNTWQKLGGASGPGGITGAVLGEPIYGTGTNTAASVVTELAVDTFAGADFGTKANAAIAALPSTGGTIRFSCTNYAASNTTITVSVNNVTLQGCGAENSAVYATGATTLNFAAGVSGIVSTGSNLQIRDLMLSSASTGAGSDNGISLTNAKPMLWDVGVRHFGGSGILFNNNTDRWNMTNVESAANYGDGFKFTAVSDDNIGFAVNLSAVYNGGYGYNIAGGGGNVFQTTHASQNTGGGWFVHATVNYFLNTYIETGTGSSFIFDAGISNNVVEFDGGFGYPTTYTDGGTNVKRFAGLNTAISLARSVTATSVVGTDTITLSTTPTFAKQTQPGLEINFVPAGSNTTNSVTIALNGMAALPVQKLSPTGPISLSAGDLITSMVAGVMLDPTATFWTLTNPANAAFVGGVPGALGDLLFSSGTNSLFVDSGNAYYDLPNKIFYVPQMRLNSATDGYVSYVAGTGTLPTLAANSTGFSAPPSGGTPGLIKLPATLSAGVLTLGTPGTVNGVNQSQTSITPIATTSTPNALVQTTATGAIDPSFIFGPSALRIEDNFCFGVNTNAGLIGQGWNFALIGSAPVVANPSNAVWPYICGVALKTAVAATAGQGGYLTPSGASGSGITGIFGDLTANSNWSSTWIFKLAATANVNMFLGLNASTLGVIHNPTGVYLRYDPISSLSSTANTSISCTAAGVCTVTVPSTILLAGQSITIAGATCSTRPGINGTVISNATNGTTTYSFNSPGPLESSCPTPGTSTSTAETTFKVCTHGNLSNASNYTCTDTGVAADTNWHKIIMASTTPGTVIFTMDATAPITISTYMPTGAFFTPEVSVATLATAQTEVDVNYFNFIMTGLTR